MFQLTWIELNTEVLNFGIDNNVWYTCKKWQVFLKRDIGRENCYLFSVQVHLWIKRNYTQIQSKIDSAYTWELIIHVFEELFTFCYFRAVTEVLGILSKGLTRLKSSKPTKVRENSSFCNSLVIRFFRWNRFLCSVSSDLFLIEWHRISHRTSVKRAGNVLCCRFPFALLLQLYSFFWMVLWSEMKSALISCSWGCVSKRLFLGWTMFAQRVCSGLCTFFTTGFRKQEKRTKLDFST